MANSFGTDILIQGQDPKSAAAFYVEHLGFKITDDNPNMIGLHGKHINLFIEPGPALGPVLEPTGSAGPTGSPGTGIGTRRNTIFELAARPADAKCSCTLRTCRGATLATAIQRELTR
jgi:catechol 2,3-dioxygenase-like lactoylglutathione lyase family enzyme